MLRAVPAANVPPAAAMIGFVPGDRDGTGSRSGCFTSCSVAGVACVLAVLWLQAIVGTENTALVVFLKPRENPDAAGGVTFGEIRSFPDEPAAFGPRVPSRGLLGALQLASPDVYACGGNLTLVEPNGTYADHVPSDALGSDDAAAPQRTDDDSSKQANVCS